MLYCAVVCCAVAASPNPASLGAHLLTLRDDRLATVSAMKVASRSRAYCLHFQVWCDGHKKARGDSSYLTLWQPVAPAGYVAMGLLASLGGREPASFTQVRPASSRAVISPFAQDLS
eukprot:GHUV01045098.1.p1 GENE.GHUV01045098.1~~GHUV01045098.1.p1  ORF type:complete len:117 (-),score=24.96 GHUV01045098.1:362-712(-)